MSSVGLLRGEAMDSLRPPVPEPEADAARRDLTAYAMQVHGWQALWHHREWARHLVETDRNLLIVAPPGCAKTAWVGIAYCGWYLGNHPERHIIYCSNTATQAVKPSKAVREVILVNKRYQEIFGQHRLHRRLGSAEANWFLERPDTGDKDATFCAVGLFGPVLGGRGDTIIMDDVCDEENMATQYMRDKTWNWISTTLFSRRTDTAQLKTRFICIMTRWHHDDVAGHLKGLDYEVIEMPVISPETGRNIWPEKYTPEVLEQAKLGNPRRFMGMYMANPTPPEGALWKSEHWKYYETCVPRFCIQSWDTAFKPEEENDYSVCQTWGLTDVGYVLLDVWRQKVKFPELQAAAKRLYEQYQPNIVLIEDKASGQSLIQVLQAETRIPVLAVKAEKDKATRSWAVVGLQQAGRVWLPKTASWLPEFEQEMEEFPDSRYDDQVDACSQALAYLRQFGDDMLSVGSDVSEARVLELQEQRAPELQEASSRLGLYTGAGEALSGWVPSRWRR